MSSPFSAELVPERETLVVAAQGELDIAAVADLHAALDEARAAGFDQVVLDLSGVTFIDSAGVAVVLSAAADRPGRPRGRRRARLRPRAGDPRAHRRARRAARPPRPGSGPLHVERDRADVAVAVALEGGEREALVEDPVAVVALVALAAVGVRRRGEDRVADRVVEVQLRRQDRLRGRGGPWRGCGPCGPGTSRGRSCGTRRCRRGR